MATDIDYSGQKMNTEIKDPWNWPMPNRSELMSNSNGITAARDMVRPKTVCGLRGSRIFSANLHTDDIRGKCNLHHF